jgi:hypothetical protein
MVFRRRPSDDEMREELEAYVGMRAEHDGVDQTAAAHGVPDVPEDAFPSGLPPGFPGQAP